MGQSEQEKKQILKSIDDFPAAIKSRIVTLSGLFIGGGTALLLIFLTAGMASYWYLPVLVMVYGVYLVWQLYHLAASDKIREKEGVLIDKEKGGYRKQHSFLVIQTPEGNVYRVLATERSRQYRVGDIVRFYSTPNALNHLKDGVFEVRVIYAIERVSAKVTTDEEDKKILSQENIVSEENNQDT